MYFLKICFTLFSSHQYHNFILIGFLVCMFFNWVDVMSANIFITIVIISSFGLKSKYLVIKQRLFLYNFIQLLMEKTADFNMTVLIDFLIVFYEKHLKLLMKKKNIFCKMTLQKLFHLLPIILFF